MENTLVETGAKRWLIAIAIMLVAIIDVLDITIVNVVLTHMMGALNATREQITWVLTSYIVAAAIMMPLTGFIASRFGRKKTLIVCVSGFLISSALCGYSSSLLEMVIYRILQGTFGALLVPMSQYVLLDTFPKEERGTAMAIWGIGIMTAPVFGPTLGGFITDVANWRWVFFINIPVCIIALLMIWELITETPKVVKTIDWVGLFWMVIGIGSLQIFLDRGQTDDWFQSTHITVLAVTAVIALTIFTVRGFNYSDNIINLQLFKDVNFRRSCILVVLFAFGVFSLMTLQPIMMQELMKYTPYQAGLVMAPRGLTSAIGMVIVAKFITKIDPRFFMIVGLIILSVTSLLMSHFNLYVSFQVMSEVSFFQGFGVGLFFIPLSTLAFNSLSAAQEAEASGLFNFSRSLGSSIGIAVTSTLVTRGAQTSWNNLAEKFAITNVNFQHWLQAHHTTLQDPDTIAHLALELSRQSGMVAFVNVYFGLAVFFALALPVVFLLKKPKKVSAAHIGE